MAITTSSLPATYLKAREANNQHIINHEKLHLAAAGKYANGGIHIDFGKDGWATGGHVNVIMPPKVDKNQNATTLENTIQHAETIKKSAFAPSDPSEQDRKVFSDASTILFKANQLLAKKKQNGNAEKSATKQ